jgi:protein-S-isoprenylcysteine O-methyltransferase Ste14
MTPFKLFIMVVIFMTVSFLGVALKYQTRTFFRLPAPVRSAGSILHAGIVLTNILLYFLVCAADHGSLGLPAIVRIAGGLLAAPGVYLILAGAVTLRAALFFPSAGGRLITNRFYMLVRNPMYLGGIVGSFGISLAVASQFALYYTGIFAIVLDVVSRLEDRDLAARFGSEFQEYRREVPALIPTLASISAFARSFRRQSN